MLNISEQEKDLYRDGNVSKSVVISVPNLSITLTNADLISESVSLTERIETERNLSFQGCNASMFQFEIAHFNQDIRGQYIEATIQAGEGEALPLFSGYVFEQSNMTFEDVQTHITAFDALYPVLGMDVTQWYNTLPFPITLKNLRDRFFNHVGITQETVTLVNDAQQVNKSITDATIKGATILKALCQLNGRFGMYGRDGLFHYVKLGSIAAGTFPSTDTFPSETTFPSEPNAHETITKEAYNSIEYQPYDTRQVSRVCIIGQNGGVKGSNGDTTKDTFYVTDNKLAWGLVNANAAAANILDEIDEVGFTPAYIDCNGLPYVECGDIILTNTRINAISTYVLERTLSGIQALKDSLGGSIDEKRAPYTPSVQVEVGANTAAINTTNTNLATTNTNLSNLNAKVNRIDADYASIGQLNAVSARVGDLEADHVSVNQLNAVQASINYLNANAITVGNLSARLANFYGTIGIHHVVGNSGSIINADRFEVYNGRVVFFGGGGSVYLDYDRVRTILQRI